MADTVTSEIIRETADMVLFTFTNQSDGTGKTDLNVLDGSDLTYKQVLVTLDGVPDTPFCIGETLTFSGTDMEFAVVQNYVRGASTVTVYRVTSASNNEPIALTNGAVPANDETITGSVSGASSGSSSWFYEKPRTWLIQHLQLEEFDTPLVVECLSK